jgi:hypothetical protein
MYLHSHREELPMERKLKNIYKKSLAMELIRRGHDLHHTMRNRENEKYQVYVLVETPEMIRDLLAINKQIRMQQQLQMYA